MSWRVGSVGEIVIDANMDLMPLMPPPCWRCWRSPAEVDEDPQVGHEAPTHLDVSFDVYGAPLLALDVDLDEIVPFKPLKSWSWFALLLIEELFI